MPTETASLPVPHSSWEAAKARLVATMEATSDFVGIARPDGMIEFLNGAGRRLVGLDDDADVTSIRATQFYTPATLAVLTEEAFPAALRDGSWSGDGDVLTLSGERIPVSIVMVAHPSDAPGETPYLSAVMRDLRDRNRAASELSESAAALARSEARLRRAIDGGLDAFMALMTVRNEHGDITDFEIVEASPRAAELVQLSRTELVGRSVRELFAIGRTSPIFERWITVVHTHTAMAWEFETQDPRAAASWLHIQAVPLERGLALTIRDISAQKRAEAQLRLMLDLTQEVANADDATRALEIVIRKTCAAAHWEFGEAWIVTGGTQLERGPSHFASGDAALAAFDRAAADVGLTSGMDLAGAAWATGRMKMLRTLDGPMIAPVRRHAAARARLTGGVAIPVLAGKTTVAIVSFLARDPEALDAARIELATGMATQVGAIVGHKLVENALARERAFLGAVLDSLSEHVTVCHPDGQLALLNRATRRTLGIPLMGQFSPDDWKEGEHVLYPDGVTPYPPDELPHARVLRDGGSVTDLEYVVGTPGRPPRTMLANANLVIGPDGTLFGSVCASRDVTSARKAEADLRESESRFRGVLETVRSLALTLDVDGRITFANDALLALCGRSREEVLGLGWADLFTNDDMSEEAFRAMVAAGELTAHIENQITSWQGEARLIAWDATMLYDSDGVFTGTATIGRDITEQRALEARLADMSENDDLTGLSNRRGFRRMAEQQLKVGRRNGRRGAILYVDLDELKPINDRFGHAAGDDALRAAADVLRNGIRESDLIGRLGGDEFAIYASDITTLDEAEIVASRLMHQLADSNRAATAAGRPFTVAFTIGAATVAAEDDLDSALARADAVLNARKAQRGPRRGS